jgi:ribosomal protein L24
MVLEIGDVVDVVRGKYNGQRGTVLKLTPQQVYVRLENHEIPMRVYQTSVANATDRDRSLSNSIESSQAMDLEPGQVVDMVRGKYSGQRGTVLKFTPQQVYVRLESEKKVRVFKTSVVNGSVELDRSPSNTIPRSQQTSSTHGLEVHQQVNVVQGVYRGRRGRVSRPLTSSMVYVQLEGDGKEVRIMHASVAAVAQGQENLTPPRREASSSSRRQTPHHQGPRRAQESSAPTPTRPFMTERTIRSVTPSLNHVRNVVVDVPVRSSFFLQPPTAVPNRATRPPSSGHLQGQRLAPDTSPHFSTPLLATERNIRTVSLTPTHVWNMVVDEPARSSFAPHTRIPLPGMRGTRPPTSHRQGQWLALESSRNTPTHLVSPGSTPTATPIPHVSRNVVVDEPARSPLHGVHGTRPSPDHHNPLLRAFLASQQSEMRSAGNEGLIQSLPVSNVQDPCALPAQYRECVICLEDFSAGRNARKMLPCLHGFHSGCIDTWLRHQPACPLCKRSVVAECARLRCLSSSLWPSRAR